jgi:hypothetical protein
MKTPRCGGGGGPAGRSEPAAAGGIAAPVTVNPLVGVGSNPATTSLGWLTPFEYAAAAKIAAQ